ncbi:hypothetical protein D3C85_1771390 [compost metagenome]
MLRCKGNPVYNSIKLVAFQCFCRPRRIADISPDYLRPVRYEFTALPAVKQIQLNPLFDCKPGYGLAD